MATIEEMADEYTSNMHAVQTGIKMMSNYDPKLGDGKDLRVGVTSCQVTDHAVATLLIEKGIFTQEEYHEQLVKSSAQEVKFWTDKITAATGGRADQIKLV